MCFEKKKHDDNDKIISSSDPLLTDRAKGRPVNAESEEDELVLTEFNAKFTNYDPNEESTCIKSLTYLQFQPLMFYGVAPVLILCSGLIFGLFLFWYESLRAKFYYRKVKSMEQATHIMVDGQQTKHVVVCKLFQSDVNHPVKDTFQFRFINF